MNFNWKKVFIFLIIVIFILSSCFLAYLFVPSLLIPYTSTKFDSLRRVIDFQKELNNLGQKLNEIEKSLPKWAEQWKNQTEGINSQMKTLQTVINDYTQGYGAFDINIYDVFRQHLSQIQKSQSSRSELLKNYTSTSASTLHWPILKATNEYNMWVFEQDINFLAKNGIHLDSLASDSRLGVHDAHTQSSNILKDLLQHLESYEAIQTQSLKDLEKAQPTINKMKLLAEADLPMQQIQTWINRMTDPPAEKREQIRVFMKKHERTLGETADRVENKRDEINRVFQELQGKEAVIFSELNEEIKTQQEVMKLLEDLPNKLKKNVMIRQSVDLDKTKNEL